MNKTTAAEGIDTAPGQINAQESATVHEMDYRGERRINERRQMSGQITTGYREWSVDSTSVYGEAIGIE